MPNNNQSSKQEEAVYFLASQSTLYRHLKFYNKKNILPAEGDDGITVGRPTFVPKSKIPSLNDSVLKNYGKVDTLKDLLNDIVDIKKTERSSRGYSVNITSNAPSLSTLQKYISQLGAHDGVSMVKATGARPQGARRQMAGNSLRHNTATMITSSFVPGKYDMPKNLPERSALSHAIIEEVTGQMMRAIGLHQAFNYDMTSLYAFLGSAPSDPSHDQ